MFSKSSEKTLLLVLLAISTSVFVSALINPIVRVYAAGSFDYSLTSSGGVTLTPGNSGSTTVVATLLSGSPSNVTLSCDLTNLPPEFSGTACTFSPSTITPTNSGNATTTVMVQVPTTAFYSSRNVTITAKTGSRAPVTNATFTLVVAAKIALNPTAYASQSYANGTLITVELNSTYSPPFYGFTGALRFNETVLQFQGVDYSGSIIGSDAQPASECLDGVSAPNPVGNCNADLSYDSLGVFSLALFTNSGSNTTTGVGELFKVTFKVIHQGFSALHFVQDEIQGLCVFPCTVINVYHTVGYDGYFTDQLCGGILCKPPIVSIKAPPRPVVFRPTFFNSTAVSQNPNGIITMYNWTFSLGASHFSFNYYYNITRGGKPVTNANYTFNQFGGLTGGWVVTLGVQDNYGSRAYNTQTILVIRVWTDLGISSLSIDPTVGVVPDTVVHIVASAFNNGVNAENSTLRLSINNRNVTSQAVVDLQPNSASSLSYAWDTTGLSPRVYIVSVTLDEVRNGTVILENDTYVIQGRLQDPNNSKVGLVQLISPLPNGFGFFLGLNLPETFGLAIVLIGVAGFVFGIIKKARAPPPEPL